MSKLFKVLIMGSILVFCLAGCGQKTGDAPTAGSGADTLTATDSETAGTGSMEQRDISQGQRADSETTEEGMETAAMHCLLLGGSGDTRLFVDRDNGTLFYAPVTGDLFDEAGNRIQAEDLIAGNQVDVYGNGIMLESYPGQYPGVTQMVVTDEGSAEDLKEYQALIDQFFPEPDLSQPPQLTASYRTSLAAITFVLTGPGNYTWMEPAEDGEEGNMITACGEEVLHWQEIIENTVEGKTDMTLESVVPMEQVKVYRWPVSDWQTDVSGESEEVTVEKDSSGQYVIKDVEEGYIYGVYASWTMGEAEYAFVAGKLAQ